MKKAIILIITLLICGSVFAENSPYRFSVFGGYGASGGRAEGVTGFNPSYELVPETVAVWTLGVNLHYYLFDSLSLSAGLAYGPRKFAVKIENKLMPYNTILDDIYVRNSFQIPLMFRWGTGFYLGAGGYLAFQIGDAYEEKSGDTLNEKYLNKTDYGLLFELGYRLSNALSLGLNVEAGFAKIIDNPDGTSIGFDGKHGYVGLKLEYEIDILN